MKPVPLFVTALTLFAAAPPALARLSSDGAMLKMELSARIEQRCNERGMGLVGREHKGMRPDELVAYAYADTRLKGTRIDAPGAAVRSGSTWYHLSYSCVTSDDGLDIRSFHYSLGEPIPQQEWGAHYLVAP